MSERIYICNACHPISLCDAYAVKIKKLYSIKNKQIRPKKKINKWIKKIHVNIYD